MIFANLWIWKIFSLNILFGFFVILTTFFLYKTTFENRPPKTFILFFLLLLLLQWFTTSKLSLTQLDNDEQRIQSMRLQEYPLVHISIFNKNLWLPVARWFEDRHESTALSRIQNNLSETLDPNLYFFANHPRERVGKNEFEKFPYLYFPFFIVGLFSVLTTKLNKIYLLFILPIILYSFTGSENKFSYFALFPLFVITISDGLNKFLEKIQTYHLLKITFILFFVFVFIQTIGYAKN